MPSKTGRVKTDTVKLPLALGYSNTFQKDWTRLERSGRYDLVRLKSVMMELVAAEGPLEPSRRDHGLSGRWQDYRECHVGGDFRLIYQLTERSIVFVRTGTHVDLFE